MFSAIFHYLWFSPSTLLKVEWSFLWITKKFFYEVSRDYCTNFLFFIISQNFCEGRIRFILGFILFLGVAIYFQRWFIDLVEWMLFDTIWIWIQTGAYPELAGFFSLVTGIGVAVRWIYSRRATTERFPADSQAGNTREDTKPLLAWLINMMNDVAEGGIEAPGGLRRKISMIANT